MKTHRLKTDPEPFAALWDGRKTHELRYNDRNYQVGDRLFLEETDTAAMAIQCVPLKLTGRIIDASVSHVLRDGYAGLAPGWVILSLRDKVNYPQEAPAKPQAGNYAAKAEAMLRDAGLWPELSYWGKLHSAIVRGMHEASQEGQRKAASVPAGAVFGPGGEYSQAAINRKVEAILGGYSVPWNQMGEALAAYAREIAVKAHDTEITAQSRAMTHYAHTKTLEQMREDVEAILGPLNDASSLVGELAMFAMKVQITASCQGYNAGVEDGCAKWVNAAGKMPASASRSELRQFTFPRYKQGVREGDSSIWARDEGEARMALIEMMPGRAFGFIESR